MRVHQHTPQGLTPIAPAISSGSNPMALRDLNQAVCCNDKDLYHKVSGRLIVTRISQSAGTHDPDTDEYLCENILEQY
ncbi:hypothetical protein PRBRB14_08200 [Hallella multisaccharivorax DSM 17128]|nr:hypothetical protein PRBRB14_08200 [Hallella multisaccharivorax DSM 17128]